MSELPEPPIAAEVDLTDFPFMPLYIARCQKSKAWLRCKRQPELAFYMLNLWMRAWHECPAGSVEDDDDVLADAAMCSPEHWLEVKAAVLHGWQKCADGRLYHAVVVELAEEAWASKEARRQRTEKARQAKLQAQSARSTESVTGSVTEQRQAPRERDRDRDRDKESPPTPRKRGAGISSQIAGEFETWWPHYPNRVDRGHAIKAFARARETATLEDLIAGAKRYAALVAGKEATFIAMPATWLNGERWKDEPSAGQRNGAAHPGPAIEPWEQRIAGFRTKRFWHSSWGFKPGERGCAAPDHMLTPEERAAKHGDAP
jgi:uncharacterized protein YdaU (DUF1376 family)